MTESITRRDFLNGAALALAAGTTLSPLELLALSEGSAAPGQITKDDYPPVLTGMRGSHEGSFEVAHSLAWRGEKPKEYTLLAEDYDLVVVGGGLSGLAAAYLFRKQAGADKKILILDNHDDFGGHAKRNEFHSGGRMLLSPGGSNNLEPDGFSDTVNRVLTEIGVDLEKLDAAREPGYLMGGDLASYGLFLNAEQYGKDRIATGPWINAWQGEGDVPALVSSLGLPADQQQLLVALIEGEKDLLDDLSLLETKRYIESTPYSEFLRSRAGLSPATITLFEPIVQMIWCTGIECISFAEALLLGCPALKSVGRTGQLASKLLGFTMTGTSSPIFPDGNASVARLLVRKLIPEVAPGSTMEDIVDARFDYNQLDRGDANIRLRLNSTAVNAVNVEGRVEVSYVEGGEAYKVTGKNCILACYNGIIPHLCPELPESQKEHLQYGVKAPQCRPTSCCAVVRPSMPQAQCSISARAASTLRSLRRRPLAWAATGVAPRAATPWCSGCSMLPRPTTMENRIAAIYSASGATVSTRRHSPPSRKRLRNSSPPCSAPTASMLIETSKRSR